MLKVRITCTKESMNTLMDIISKAQVQYKEQAKALMRLEKLQAQIDEELGTESEDFYEDKQLEDDLPTQ